MLHKWLYRLYPVLDAFVHCTIATGRIVVDVPAMMTPEIMEILDVFDTGQTAVVKVRDVQHLGGTKHLLYLLKQHGVYVPVIVVIKQMPEIALTGTREAVSAMFDIGVQHITLLVMGCVLMQRIERHIHATVAGVTHDPGILIFQALLLEQHPYAVLT